VISRFLRQNAIGLVALFVALSGTAWATSKVGSPTIKDGSIRSVDLRDGQVQRADIEDGAVGSAQIANGAVTDEDLGELDLSRFTVPDPDGPMGFSSSSNYPHTLSSNAPIEAPRFYSHGTINSRGPIYADREIWTRTQLTANRIHLGPYYSPNSCVQNSWSCGVDLYLDRKDGKRVLMVGFPGAAPGSAASFVLATEGAGNSRDR
jgi:hypothetical protein